MAILRVEFWAKLLEKHGFSTLFALLLMYGLWTGSSAVFYEVAIPIRDGHLKFLDRVAASTEQTAEGVSVLADGATEVSGSMRRMEAKIDRALGQSPE